MLKGNYTVLDSKEAMCHMLGHVCYKSGGGFNDSWIEQILPQFSFNSFMAQRQENTFSSVSELCDEYIEWLAANTENRQNILFAALAWITLDAIAYPEGECLCPTVSR